MTYEEGDGTELRTKLIMEDEWVRLPNEPIVQEFVDGCVKRIENERLISLDVDEAELVLGDGFTKEACGFVSQKHSDGCWDVTPVPLNLKGLPGGNMDTTNSEGYVTDATIGISN